MYILLINNLMFRLHFHFIHLIIQCTINISRTMRDFDDTVAQLPGAKHREEGAALAAELDQFQKKRGSGPRSLAEILPAVLSQ